MNTFGAKLRSLRIKKGLSQAEAARLLGYSRVQVSNWEIERSEPDIQALGKLAEFYGATVDCITGTARSAPPPLVPITNESLDPSIERMNDPATDEINELLNLMSPEDKEAFRRLAQSVVNRNTKGVS